MGDRAGQFDASISRRGSRYRAIAALRENPAASYNEGQLQNDPRDGAEMTGAYFATRTALVAPGQASVAAAAALRQRRS
jgi:hypothetical protein